MRFIHRTLPWLTLGLAGLAVALYATLGPAAAVLVFDRVAIGDGEWWRLLTGHWVHSDRSHLGWNTGALVVLGSILEMRDRRLLPVALLAGCLGVGLLVWLALPGMTLYCGLSGVLNTLLLAVLFSLWRESGSPLPPIVGVVSLGKILVEAAAGQALFTQAAWASVPLAHLGGWILGLLLVVVGLISSGSVWTPRKRQRYQVALSLRAAFRIFQTASRSKGVMRPRQ